MDGSRFYESKGNYARAAALYQKIGQTDKAISLCLATRQYDALRKLVNSPYDRLSSDCFKLG